MSSFLYWIPKSEADPPELKSGDSPLEKIPHGEWKKEGGPAGVTGPLCQHQHHAPETYFLLPASLSVL
jgi:hypothetical protein